MPCVIVVGGQWGDEGKGKIVDRLTERAEVVVRYQGGPNAGHTVVIDGKRFALRHLPSGILRPGVLSVVGNGVVVDPAALLGEIQDIRDSGVEIGENLKISDRAHVILPEHRILDAASEDARGESSRIGTTRRGIGPAYEAKVGRMGVRMGDLLNPQLLRDKLEVYRAERFHKLGLEPDGRDVVEEYLGHGVALEGFIADTVALLHTRLQSGARLLFEGAQGTLLDLDFGTYPFVTSSNSSAGGACTGTGVGPARITGVLGVFKAYCSRVGSGPFPTEQRGESGEKIRERGREYGTVTGRPRRCGWFDAVLGRYAVRVNSMDCAALTLLDVLDEFEHVPVAVAYEHHGVRFETLPADLETFGRCEPVYEVMEGWKRPIGTLKGFGDLPAACRAYIDRLEMLLGCEIGLVSTGPERSQTLMRPHSRLDGWLAK